MDIKSEFDNFNRLVNGIYRQNTFFIKIDSLNDLEPEYGDPLPSALPVNIHEYIHYLHNVSTVAGQFYLFTNILLLRYMVNGCNDEGEFLGDNELNHDTNSSVKSILKNMRYCLGTTSTRLFEKENRFKTRTFSAPTIESSNSTDDLYIKTTSIFSIESDIDMATQSEEIIIGLSFITEGIAYEIERIIYRNNGTPDNELDKTTPTFPYLLYKEVIETWSGRKLSSEELIKIGIVSLSSFFSGHLLALICKDLKNGNITIDEVLSHYITDIDKRSHLVLNYLSTQRDSLSKGDAIYKAMVEYFNIAKHGTELRQNRFFIELEFLNGIKNTHDFYQKIQTMIDYNIFQSKMDGEIHLSWIGPRKIARDDDTVSSLAALQSMIHYSQLHIKPDGSLTKTTELHNTTCPFSCVCSTEKQQSLQDICKTKPWLNYKSAQPNELICWYAAGVKALRKAVQ